MTPYNNTMCAGNCGKKLSKNKRYPKNKYAKKYNTKPHTLCQECWKRIYTTYNAVQRVQHYQEKAINTSQ